MRSAGAAGALEAGAAEAQVAQAQVAQVTAVFRSVVTGTSEAARRLRVLRVGRDRGWAGVAADAADAELDRLAGLLDPVPEVMQAAVAGLSAHAAAVAQATAQVRALRLLGEDGGRRAAEVAEASRADARTLAARLEEAAARLDEYSSSRRSPELRRSPDLPGGIAAPADWAQARSRANEQRLRSELARLGDLQCPSEDQRRALAASREVSERLSAARARRDPLTGEPVGAYLLAFDPHAFGGQGRAAIAVGEVGSAEHVAVLVPGLGSTVASALSGLTRTAQRVRDRARRARPGQETAVVAWLGYDAPNGPAAALDAAAEVGADLLASDLAAWRDGRAGPTHLTLVGHSYGSTTAATAVRDHVTDVDDLVLLGSPGANAVNADALRVPDGHVFVGASRSDPVSYLGWFGPDPSVERFGAVRFDADDPQPGGGGIDLDAHSRYYAPGSDSLASVVSVVVGDYAGVGRAPYREEPWQLLSIPREGPRWEAPGRW